MELKDAMRVMLEAGFDVERNGYHLYKRGKAITIVKFSEKSGDTVVDELHMSIEPAIERHIELTISEKN